MYLYILEIQIVKRQNGLFRCKTGHLQDDSRDYEKRARVPVIAETYDGVLNEVNARHVTAAHVLSAINGAFDQPVQKGSAGGGTGMICYEFKGGTGTSSRAVRIGDRPFSIGVLLQANHGSLDWLTVLGESVGRQMQSDRLMDRETGSIIVIVATDLPMRPNQLERLARRASIGIGRSGTPGGASSGDIFLAFSTANPQKTPGRRPAFSVMTHINDDPFDPVYLAAVEATDEAIVNALVAARDTSPFKPPGRMCKAVFCNELMRLLRKAGKCA